MHSVVCSCGETEILKEEGAGWPANNGTQPTRPQVARCTRFGYNYFGNAAWKGEFIWQPTSCSGNFTDQGIRAVKDSTKRAEALKGIGKCVGVTVKEVYWTLGQYDVATIIEAPDEACVTAFGLSVAALGNVRTQTLRAFSAEEMGQIIGRMA